MDDILVLKVSRSHPQSSSGAATCVLLRGSERGSEPRRVLRARECLLVTLSTGLIHEECFFVACVCTGIRLLLSLPCIPYGLSLCPTIARLLRPPKALFASYQMLCIAITRDLLPCLTSRPTSVLSFLPLSARLSCALWSCVLCSPRQRTRAGRGASQCANPQSSPWRLWRQAS